MTKPPRSDSPSTLPDRPRLGPSARGFARGTLAVFALAWALAGGAVADRVAAQPPAELRHVATIDGGAVTDLVLDGDLLYLVQGTGVSVLDVSDPTAPIRIGGDPNLPFQMGPPLFSLSVAGDLGAVGSIHEGVFVLDLTDPAVPVVASLFEVNDVGFFTAISGTTLYLGTQGGSVGILDIADPYSPVLVGTIPRIEPRGSLWSVDVVGTTAFVGVFGALEIADASSPAMAMPLSSYAFAGTGSAGFAGVALAGTTAYWGTTRAGLRVLDVANLAAPVETHVLLPGSDVWGVEVRGTTVAALEREEGLKLLDAAAAGGPSLVGEFPSPVSPTYTAVALAESHAFMAVDASGLEIVDVSDPANPTLALALDAPDPCFDLAAEADLVCAAGVSGLLVLDVSNPAAPNRVGAVAVPFVQAVALREGMALVGSSFGVFVADVSDPTAAVLGGGVLAGAIGAPRAAAFAGPTLAVVGTDAGLRLLDVSDPAAPAAIGAADTAAPVLALAVEGARVAMGAGTKAVLADVADPAAPAILGEVELFGEVGSIVLSGTTIFASASDRGLHAIDASDPAAPAILRLIPGDGDADLVLAGDRLFAASGSVEMYDVSDPATPVLLDVYVPPPSRASATEIAIAGDLVFGAGLGFTVLDASAPEATPEGILATLLHGAPPSPVLDSDGDGAVDGADLTATLLGLR